MKKQTRKQNAADKMVLLIVSLIMLSLLSCMKEKDLLLGRAVEVNLPPSQPEQDSDLSISYANPLILPVNEEINTITPTVDGQVYPEIIPNYVITIFGNNSRVSGDAHGPNPLDVTFRAPISFHIDENIVINLLEDGDYLYHSRIRRLLPYGDIRSSIFVGGGNDQININGTGISATFDVPLGIDKHPITGDFYVTDKNRIRIVTPEGVVTTFTGALDNATGYVNGSPENARFSYINDLVFDKDGNLYVSDRDNQCIRKYTAATNQFTTLCGPPETFTGTKSGYVDGLGSIVRFNGPAGIAVDPDGSLYVVDRTNRRIRKITSNGNVTTILGNGTSAVVNGTGTSTSFRDPWFITRAKTGELYISEYNGNVIRKVSTTLEVTTLTGKGTGNSVDGLINDAELGRLSGIKIAPNGNIYFAERDGALRMIIQCAYSISPELPMGLKFDPYTGAISGKPTQSTAQATYTVTAYSGRGEPVKTTEFYLTVQ